jgi:hypothetical protein
MLCIATLSFIAISLAYFIVSIAGYNTLPSSLFLVGVVIIGAAVQAACSFVGEAFGWGALVLMGVIFYIYMAASPKPSRPSSGGGCGCCARPRCGGCCPRPRPRPCPTPICGNGN